MAQGWLNAQRHYRIGAEAVNKGSPDMPTVRIPGSGATVRTAFGFAATLAMGLFAGTGALKAQPDVHRDMVVESSVQAGSQARIWFVWGLLPDCSTRRGFNVRVARTPQYGVASLQKTNEIVSDDWVQPHMGRRKVRQASYCAGRTAPVISVFYRPKSGFRGDDEMSVVITNAKNSRQDILKFKISVR